MSSSATKAIKSADYSAQLWRVIFYSLLAGAILTTIWPAANMRDAQFGVDVASSVLGEDASAAPIGGALSGALFAILTGLAGTFTACNICAFSAIAPLAAEKERTVGQLLRPMLYMSGGIVLVAGLYGFFGTLIGPALPQLSGDMALVMLQSSVVFVAIGLIFVAWGLMTLEVIPNPFSGVSLRFPNAHLVFMGGLIGAFLIGRPFPLFIKLFQDAVASNNPVYGALIFILQSLGNIVIMVLLLLFLTYGTGGRFERWLTAKPGRVHTVTAVALLVGGGFLVFFWAFRMGLGFWPGLW